MVNLLSHFPKFIYSLCTEHTLKEKEWNTSYKRKFIRSTQTTSRLHGEVLFTTINLGKQLLLFPDPIVKDNFVESVATCCLPHWPTKSKHASPFSRPSCKLFTLFSRWNLKLLLCWDCYSREFCIKMKLSRVLNNVFGKLLKHKFLKFWTEY